jgi:lysophospholipase L1-like esterase
MHRQKIYPLIATVAAWFTFSLHAEEPVAMQVTGDWSVKLLLRGGKPVEVAVPVSKPIVLNVKAEKINDLPVFNPKAGGWVKGAQLKGVKAQETTTPHLLDTNSLVLRAGPETNAAVFKLGVDYEADLVWGTIGRTTNGAIKAGQPVYASYQHAQLRIDSVALTREGGMKLYRGEPRAAAPLPPAIPEGERRLGNIWLPGKVAKLGPEHLFPISENAYPETAKPSPTVAEKLVPNAMKKLRNGEPLRILAWGDSVTVGTYVPNPATERWQEQFVAQLRARFPQAKIELMTEAWGGRNTGSYLAEPPGSEHNYKEKVLAKKPDLIISEFVNDAGLKPAQVEERYSKLLADFQGIGAEWIILTPHYVRPDWMGLNRERDVDDDPRPYVAGLREFSARHHIALADAAKRYGRLWRQGIPYSTIMLNSINHPDARGMKIFADALMELFP